MIALHFHLQMNYFIYTLHGMIWIQQIDLVPNVWLHSLVGRASHRHRGGHRFQSRYVEALILFRLLLSSCLNWKISCDDRSSLSINNYYTSDSLWKIWLVESIQSIYNSLWTWHDKCNICCRYCIYHVKFNICLVTKPLGVFSSETEWLNASLLFLRMNYVD